MSLFQMMLQRAAYSHLTSSLPLLDEMLSFTFSNAIFDLESVPGCNAPYQILCSLIVSHLRENPDSHSIVVVDLILPFPWKLLEKFPGFSPDWKSRITHYRIDSFVKLLHFFRQDNNLNADASSTLVILNGIHDFIDHYKLQIWTSHKQTLLKFHVHRNDIALQNRQRVEQDPEFKLPELPAGSDLLKESPLSKADKHIFHLFDLISKFTIRNDSLVFLVGQLDSKYVKYPPLSANTSFTETQIKQTQSLNSNLSSTSGGSGSDFGNGRMMFVPSLSNTKDPKKSVDSFITARLVFYYDWYHNCETYPGPAITDASQLRMVFVVQVYNLQSIGIFSPIYFDYDDDHVFVDYSKLVVSHIPSQLPSSPNMTESQVKQFLPDAFDLVIEDSDDDLDDAILRAPDNIP